MGLIIFLAIVIFIIYVVDYLERLGKERNAQLENKEYDILEEVSQETGNNSQNTTTLTNFKPIPSFEQDKPKNAVPKLKKNVERIPGQLEISYQIEKDTTFGDLLQIKIKGGISVPYDYFSVGFIIVITDVTDSNKIGQVYSKMNDLCDSDTQFWFSETVKLPHQHSIFRQPLNLVKFPLSGLLLPYSGDRVLRLSLVVVNDADIEEIYYNRGNLTISKIILIDFVELQYHFEGYGYLESFELYRDSLKEVIKLLYLIAKADGLVLKSEMDRIYDFLNKRINFVEDQHKREELRKELKQEIDWYMDKESMVSDNLLEQATYYLKKNTNVAYCLEVFEICLQIAVADNEFSPEEKSLIEDIAYALDISDEKQKELYERHLRLKMAGQLSDEEILGIIPTMSLAEKKAHLTKEYNKWRGRISNEDKEIATEANMRIEKITNLRDTLNKTG